MQLRNRAVTRRNINSYERSRIAALTMQRLSFAHSEAERPIIRQTTDYLTGSNSAVAQRFLPIGTAELTKPERARVGEIIVALTLVVNDRNTNFKRSVIHADRRDALLQRITELNAADEPEVLVAAAS